MSSSESDFEEIMGPRNMKEDLTGNSTDEDRVNEEADSNRTTSLVMKVMGKGLRKTTDKEDEHIEECMTEKYGSKGYIQHRCFIEHFVQYIDAHRPTAKQQSLLNKTAFSKLINIGKVDIERRVLQWIVEQYQGGRQFKLGNRVLNFTDEDIGAILGIPSTGFTVTVKGRHLQWKSYISEEIFDAGMIFNRKKLVNILMDFYDRDDDDSVALYVTYLILFMFSTFLFPDCGYSFPRDLLHYVESLEDTRFFNWSDAVAKMILFNMEDVRHRINQRRQGSSRTTLGYLTGCVACLYVWMLEYCCKDLFVNRDLRPRIRKWAGSIKGLSRRIASLNNEQILGGLNPHKNEIFKIGSDEYVFPYERFIQYGFSVRRPQINLRTRIKVPEDGPARRGRYKRGDFQIVKSLNQETTIRAGKGSEKQCMCDDFSKEIDRLQKVVEELSDMHNDKDAKIASYEIQLRRLEEENEELRGKLGKQTQAEADREINEIMTMEGEKNSTEADAQKNTLVVENISEIEQKMDAKYEAEINVTNRESIPCFDLGIGEHESIITEKNKIAPRKKRKERSEVHPSSLTKRVKERNAAKRDVRDTREIIHSEADHEYLCDPATDFIGYDNISEEQRRLIQDFLRDPADKFNATYFTPLGIFCKGKEIYHFLYEKMIEDSILEMFMDVLRHRYCTGDTMPFLFTPIYKMQYFVNTVDRATKEELNHLDSLHELEDERLVGLSKVFTVIQTKNHWHLLVADFTARKFYAYNSMRGSKIHKKDAQKWHEWMCECFGMVLVDETMNDWDIIYVVDSPQQPPHSLDCGVYVMKTMEYLCEGMALDFSFEDIPRFRAEIACTLLTCGHVDNEAGN